MQGLFVFFILLLFLMILVYKFAQWQTEKKFREVFEEWHSNEVKRIKTECERQMMDVVRKAEEEVRRQEEIIKKEYEIKLEKWKQDIEKKIRQDAIKRSTDVVKGKVAEQLAPIVLIEKAGFNPRDMRFIGSPIDYVVFDGLNDGKIKRIVFVEVKTGVSDLSKRERMIRDAIREKKIEWYELRL